MLRHTTALSLHSSTRVSHVLPLAVLRVVSCCPVSYLPLSRALSLAVPSVRFLFCATVLVVRCSDSYCLESFFSLSQAWTLIAVRCLVSYCSTLYIVLFRDFFLIVPSFDHCCPMSCVVPCFVWVSQVPTPVVPRQSCTLPSRVLSLVTTGLGTSCHVPRILLPWLVFCCSLPCILQFHVLCFAVAACCFLTVPCCILLFMFCILLFLMF